MIPSPTKWERARVRVPPTARTTLPLPSPTQRAGEDSLP